MAVSPDYGVAGAAPHGRSAGASAAQASGRKRSRRHLSARQTATIEYVIRMFVEEDLERGVSPSARIHGAGCSADRPRPGAITYDQCLLCNDCATEYEVARVNSPGLTAGRFVRDKTFGDGEQYMLPSYGGRPWRVPPRGL